MWYEKYVLHNSPHVDPTKAHVDPTWTSMSTSNSPGSKKLVLEFCSEKGLETWRTSNFVTISHILHNACSDVDLPSYKYLIGERHHNNSPQVHHLTSSHRDKKPLATGVVLMQQLFIGWTQSIPFGGPQLNPEGECGRGPMGISS